MSEQARLIADKAMGARETMRNLFGEKYAQAVAPYRDMLRTLLVHKVEPSLAGCLHTLVKKAHEGPDRDVVKLWLLAAFADEAEGT